MSQENVEVVRAVFDAAASRDRSRVLTLYDQDVEFDVIRGGIAGVMERTVYHGHDGLRRLFREWYEAWESAEDVLEELIDTGDNGVSVATTHHLDVSPATSPRAGMEPARRGSLDRALGPRRGVVSRVRKDHGGTHVSRPR